MTVFVHEHMFVRVRARSWTTEQRQNLENAGGICGRRGLMYAPYPAVFPLGSTLDWAADPRTRPFVPEAIDPEETHR